MLAVSLRNIIETLLVPFAAAFFAATAGSAFPLKPEGETQVQVSARVDAVYYDDGLKSNDDYEPTKVTNLYQSDLKLAVDLSVTNNTKFKIVTNPMQKDIVGRAILLWQGSPGFSVIAGKDYVNIGGWDQKTWDFDTILVSPYVKTHMPWIKEKETEARVGPASSPSLAVAANLNDMGMVTLQAVNDVVVGEDKAAVFSHTRRQPSLLLEFLGSGETLKPLFQIGSYDLLHSITADLGLAVTGKEWDAHIDFSVDHRRHPPTNDGPNITKYYSLTADLTYDFGSLEILGKIAALDVQQPGGDYGVDHKGNHPGVEFDDNAFDVAVGSRYKLDGEAFKPYFAIVRRTGHFLKNVDEPQGPVDEKSDLAIQIGTTSRF